MRTQEINIYEFKELNKDAKLRAIEANRDIEIEYDWYAYTYELFTEEAQVLGIKISDMWFSGFYSQGDGACFEGSYEYSPTGLNASKENEVSNIINNGVIERLYTLQSKYDNRVCCPISVLSSNYYHSKTMTLGDIEGVSHLADLEYITLEKELLLIFQDMADCLHNRLESEHEYLTSDAVVSECLINNDIEFLGDGSVTTL